MRHFCSDLNLTDTERCAAEHLKRTSPNDSAAFIPTTIQRVLAILFITLFTLSIWAWPTATFDVLRVLAITAFLSLALFRLGCAAMFKPMRTQLPAAANYRLDWPTYSIIAPMYQEGPVAQDFINRLRKLDYPHDKLDVIVMLETDDTDTQAALNAMDIPAWVRVVTLPHGKPKTKPKACNVALTMARGEYITIYDAEDAPTPTS